MYSRIALWYVIFLKCVLESKCIQNANAFIWRQDNSKCIQKDSIDRLMELLTLEQQKETWKTQIKTASHCLTEESHYFAEIMY